MSSTTTQPSSTPVHQRLRPVLLALPPAAILACTFVAGRTHGGGAVAWIAAAVLLTIASASLTYWLDRRAVAHAITVGLARSIVAKSVNRSAEPVIGALNSVAASTCPEECHTSVQVLVSRVVDHSYNQCWLPEPTFAEIRCTYYELVGKEQLRRRHFGGRADVPRRDFKAERSLHDQEAIRLALDERSLLVNDLHTAPPPHFEDSLGRPYRSLVAVPVRAGGTSYGLLVLDAAAPGTFGPIDLGQLQLMANLLGAGLAHEELVSKT
ncbi:GAF domain-containing protein [Allocatelliglobosispora scoriae]|uniref:GAF domain-containing protein n=1 Tax=Allocatelliglobosispora scoriae TaxID=643052 RepID=A0A841BIQ1_9ACTN|nr:GAF domain-containing protein [Allocatelliglobosispora scoriae]MBB5868997.1 GAF domain-containing protein [Allocatelliglobosispora scoriae]